MLARVHTPTPDLGSTQAFKNLTVAQHTQLILTLVHSLGSSNYLRCDLAAQLLLMICEEPCLKKEQVRQGERGSLETRCTCPCEHVPYTFIHM